MAGDPLAAGPLGRSPGRSRRSAWRWPSSGRRHARPRNGPWPSVPGPTRPRSRVGWPPSPPPAGRSGRRRRGPRGRRGRAAGHAVRRRAGVARWPVISWSRERWPRTGSGWPGSWRPGSGLRPSTSWPTGRVPAARGRTAYVRSRSGWRPGRTRRRTTSRAGLPTRGLRVARAGGRGARQPAGARGRRRLRPGATDHHRPGQVAQGEELLSAIALDQSQPGDAPPGRRPAVAAARGRLGRALRARAGGGPADGPGLGNAEIATRLEVSEHTVRVHASRVLAAYPVASRTHLALELANRLPLVPGGVAADPDPAAAAGGRAGHPGPAEQRDRGRPRHPRGDPGAARREHPPEVAAGVADRARGGAVPPRLTGAA